MLNIRYFLPNKVLRSEALVKILELLFENLICDSVLLYYFTFSPTI